MQYKIHPKSDVVITQMVPSTNLNEGELSNYIMKPILSNNQKELLGFVALQLPILKILKTIQSMDPLLHAVDITVIS